MSEMIRILKKKLILLVVLERILENYPCRVCSTICAERFSSKHRVRRIRLSTLEMIILFQLRHIHQILCCSRNKRIAQMSIAQMSIAQIVFFFKFHDRCSPEIYFFWSLNTAAPKIRTIPNYVYSNICAERVSDKL
jgi:hypothetical protein